MYNSSLKQQIGQMIVVRTTGHLFDHQIRYPKWEADNATLQRWLKDLNLGGVILLGGSAAELKLRSQQLQSWATTPLFIAADIEEGVGQRFPGATWFPPPMALSAIARDNLTLACNLARQMGTITAQEAVATGINWLLAPVVDVNNNPDNPVINIRAFGDTPEIVSKLTTAFIEGARQHPILTTAKHFPGHGDTATDSHLDLPIIPHSDARLASVEIPPFQSAIASSVDSVMTAHLLISAWDKNYPATLSPSILTQKLREELGFSGLVVTDALIMGGITKYASPEEVAVMTVEAGADILLMPDDPAIAIESILQAVESGRISEARIHQSSERIKQAKAKITSNCPESNSLNFLSQLSQPQATQTVTEILEHSTQWGGNLPLRKPENQAPRNLVITDNLLNSSFLDLYTPAIAIPEKLGYQTQILDHHSLDCILLDSSKTLLQIFIRGNPFRGTAGLTTKAKNIYQQLLEQKQVIGLIIYGSPYILDWFKPLLPSELAWVFTYGQMRTSQHHALQKLFNLSEDINNTKPQNFGF
ncbi:MAG: glycoside hydrolase family 3 N-terminal domain-containing protein [Xenococcaceae cyanobacterium MO_207.B15]|nr:glycoside hydrolase family 3 N-terminal domain-containing protein [Xenococcaceae cyanobacterium MO_207.B15]